MDQMAIELEIHCILILSILVNSNGNLDGFLKLVIMDN